jgi:hypothetical protein
MIKQKWFTNKESEMETLDLKMTYKSLYLPSAKAPAFVDIPDLQFLQVDGAIEPGLSPGESPLFQENTSALYNIAYTLKFMLKQRKENPVDYPVMALEGLWWVEDGVFDITIKDNWFYTLMIMVPDLINPDLFAAALAQMRKKKGDQPGFARLQLERFREGPCVQIMHIGPYATEPASVEVMRQFMQAHGYQDLVGLGGKHHEIYLGDPRRADPAKLKTVLRHPVR